MKYTGFYIGNSVKPEYRVIVVFFVVVIFLSPLVATGQRGLPDTISSLWMQYKATENDSSKVTLLSRLSFFYLDFLMDDKTSDSLAELAVQIAGKTQSRSLITSACNNYVESTDNRIYMNKAIHYSFKALALNKTSKNSLVKWRIIKNISTIYLVTNKIHTALIYANSCLAIAREIKNERLTAESYLLVGRCYANDNQNLKAFRNYLLALHIAEKTNDCKILKQCFSNLSALYDETRLWEDALEYKEKEKALILSEKPVDSTALMWTINNTHTILVRMKKDELLEQSVLHVIDYAVKTSNYRLKVWEFAVYRTYLIERNDINRLQILYNTIFPGELDKLFAADPELYYRLQCYFMEFNGKPDLALNMFRKAEHFIEDNPSKIGIYQAHFFIRYGQFLIRNNRKNEAIVKFTQAIQIAEKYGSLGKFQYIQIASENLEQLYSELGDYKNAWYYASARIRINDSLQRISNNAQVKAEEVIREREQHKIIAEKDQQKIRQGNTQRNVMAGFLVFLLILSFLVYRNYINQKRMNRLLDAEKKKSDNLLLNILPVETAEELKQTGTAKAKRFDEVSVMFTDFKDFTLTSEKMSAEELVTKIHFYFSEFDRIISAYAIEKIKIIGDSYMCAAGLPIPNKSHAVDLVRAALELQDFMADQKKQQGERNEPYFELRIGIHTGPVVAGIVGLNKFAYDIWGDTVNTASRLESSGEIDKVNISGTTYELVKDHFHCTYRGKIKAKNKGEIDMYFVDPDGSIIP